MDRTVEASRLNMRNIFIMWIAMVYKNKNYLSLTNITHTFSKPCVRFSTFNGFLVMTGSYVSVLAQPHHTFAGNCKDYEDILLCRQGRYAPACESHLQERWLLLLWIRAAGWTERFRDTPWREGGREIYYLWQNKRDSMKHSPENDIWLSISYKKTVANLFYIYRLEALDPSAA